MLENRSRFWCVLAVFSLVVWTGCSRQPVPDYVESEAFAELPESHQEQIREQLTRYFGTPLNPRMRAPVEADETSEDASSEDASSEDDGEVSEEGGDEVPETPLEDLVDPDHLAHGAEVYRTRCAGCHGVSGDGGGPAAESLQPKPRDYRRGIYKFTSTPYGAKPARIDLVRTIRRGAKGTSMPPFPWMSDEDLNAVVDYVILLSQRGELEEYITVIASEDYDAEDPIEEYDFLDGLASIRESWEMADEQVVLPVTARPAYDSESIALGREAFMTQGCAKCHGEDGKGQTDWLSQEFLETQENAPADQRIEINYDAWGHPAPAADLTARLLHGGRRPIDIYRRIYTGINGTPMPAFEQAFAETPETIWHLVHFILSVVEGQAVQEADGAAATDEVAQATRR